MADDFYLDPEGVHGTVSRVSATAAKLSGSFDKLEHTLALTDGCWSDDDIGKNFAKGYVDDAHDVVQGARYAVEGLRGWGTGVSSTAEQFSELDGDNASAIDGWFADKLENPPSD